MKYIYCFSVGFFLFIKSYSQLTSLYTNKSVYDKSKNRIFKQFNFKVKYENDDYSIKSLNGDSILFRIKPSVFYEIYDNKFLIASISDSFYIKIGSSNQPSFLPRKVAYIMPVESFLHSKETYKVDFKNIIIVEDWKFRYPKDTSFYKIKKIDLIKREVVIYNLVNKETKTFFLSRVDN